MEQKVQQVLFADIDIDSGEIGAAKSMLSPLPIIRDTFNSKYFPKRGEINNEPSLTIPDQEMPIGDMMRRLANGLPLNGKVPLYAEEGDMPDTSKMDLAEKEALIKEVQEEVQEINKRHRERIKKAKEFELEKLVQERMKQKAKEAENTNLP